MVTAIGCDEAATAPDPLAAGCAGVAEPAGIFASIEAGAGGPMNAGLTAPGAPGFGAATMDATGTPGRAAVVASPLAGALGGNVGAGARAGCPGVGFIRTGAAGIIGVTGFTVMSVRPGTGAVPTGRAVFVPETGTCVFAGVTAATGAGADFTLATGAATGDRPAPWDDSGGARGGCQAWAAGAEAARGVAGLADTGGLFAIGAAATVRATGFAAGFTLVAAGEGDGGSSWFVADVERVRADFDDAGTTRGCIES